MLLYRQQSKLLLSSVDKVLGISEIPSFLSFFWICVWIFHIIESVVQLSLL